MCDPAGFAEVARENGLCYIQVTNEFFRDNSSGSYPESILKVWQSSATGSPHSVDALYMVYLALDYVAW
jgi:hypothetical protein